MFPIRREFESRKKLCKLFQNSVQTGSAKIKLDSTCVGMYTRMHTFVCRGGVAQWSSYRPEDKETRVRIPVE
jgi:hypothetical protein